MLKQLTAAILLLAFMASNFCSTVIVMDYYANTSAYAKNCENKALPKIHCNGKCQMMKKLQQQEKPDQGNPERKQANKFEVISSGSFFATASTFQQPAARYYATLFIPAPVDISYSLLRPPRAA